MDSEKNILRLKCRKNTLMFIRFLLRFSFQARFQKYTMTFVLKFNVHSKITFCQSTWRYVKMSIKIFVFYH